MFDPDLINKFQQNLRMAQIHSAGGVNEDNFKQVCEYVNAARNVLFELAGGVITIDDEVVEGETINE